MSAMTKLSEVWGTKKGKGIKTLQISELRQICRTSEYNNKVRCVKNSNLKYNHGVADNKTTWLSNLYYYRRAVRKNLSSN